MDTDKRRTATIYVFRFEHQRAEMSLSLRLAAARDPCYLRAPANQPWEANMSRHRDPFDQPSF